LYYVETKALTLHAAAILAAMPYKIHTDERGLINESLRFSVLISAQGLPAGGVAGIFL
jgi:hypothetical protein